jgi:hypothetical protein
LHLMGEPANEHSKLETQKMGGDTDYAG